MSATAEETDDHVLRVDVAVDGLGRALARPGLVPGLFRFGWQVSEISGEVRRWRLHRRITLTIGEIAKKINPIVRGWTQYYGAFEAGSRPKGQGAVPEPTVRCSSLQCTTL